MAELVAGVRYGLSSRNSIDKPYVFLVKFTDSALRALEEYSKYAVSKFFFKMTPKIINISMTIRRLKSPFVRPTFDPTYTLLKPRSYEKNFFLTRRGNFFLK